MNRDHVKYQLHWIGMKEIKLPQQRVMQNSDTEFNKIPEVSLKVQNEDEQTQLLRLFYDLSENNLNTDKVI